MATHNKGPVDQVAGTRSMDECNWDPHMRTIALLALQSRSCYRTAEPVLLHVSHCGCRAGLAIACAHCRAGPGRPKRSPASFNSLCIDHRAKSPPRASLCNQIGLDLGITAVGWDWAESIKRSASDRLGDLVPQRVRARTFQGFSLPGVSTLWVLCLEKFFPS